MHAFDNRDGTLEVLRDGGYRMTPTAHALLWFLLFHGIYDRGSEWFGHVDIRVTGQAILASAVGRNRKAVGLALTELEAYGFIKRTKRYPAGGGRLADDIELSSPDDFCFACRGRGHQKDSCRGAR
jgi:hypothetical protein